MPKKAPVQLQFDGEEVIATHAFRNGKIFFTILISPTLDGRWRIHAEGDPTHLDEVVQYQWDAINRADMYLSGMTLGYDMGMEAGLERNQYSRDRTTTG